MADICTFRKTKKLPDKMRVMVSKTMCWRLATFPTRSIIASKELNFFVRNVKGVSSSTNHQHTIFDFMRITKNPSAFSLSPSLEEKDSS